MFESYIWDRETEGKCDEQKAKIITMHFMAGPRAELYGLNGRSYFTSSSSAERH